MKATAALKEVEQEQVPAFDQRFLNRKQIYKSDNIRCEITTKHGSVRGTVLDMTHRGLGIAIRPEHATESFDEGIEVQVQIKTAAGESLPLNGVVLSARPFQIQGTDYLRLSVRVSGTPHADLDVIRIIGKCFQIGEFLAPQAYAESPLFFSYVMLFRILALSPRGGILLTSASNKSVVPGIPFTLTVLLPNHGPVIVEAIPLRVRENPENDRTYYVDIEIKNTGPAAMEAFSEFLLMATPDVSLDALRNAGMFVGRIDKSIHISHPIHRQDYQEMLALRLKAYHEVGKFSDKSTPDEMRDEFDSYSRHILCRIGGKLVGSIRVVFVGTDPSRSEHASFGIAIPEFIARAGFVEMSRACTHSAYRGSDVSMRLVQESIRIAVQAEMAYVLANCNGDLWPLYKSIGAQKAGKPFTAFGRTDCQLIYFDTKKVAHGRAGQFLVWNQVTFPVSHFLYRFRAGLFSFALIPVLAVHKFLYPVVKELRTRKMHAQYQRKQAERFEE